MIERQREVGAGADGDRVFAVWSRDHLGTLLDGSETEMRAPDGKPLLAKAVWAGKKLVMTVHSPELKQDIRRQTWTMDADGQLVIDTELLGGKPQAPLKEVFKRR